MSSELSWIKYEFYNECRYKKLQINILTLKSAVYSSDDMTIGFVKIYVFIYFGLNLLVSWNYEYKYFNLFEYYETAISFK